MRIRDFSHAVSAVQGVERDPSVSDTLIHVDLHVLSNKEMEGTTRPVRGLQGATSSCRVSLSIKAKLKYLRNS